MLSKLIIKLLDCVLSAIAEWIIVHIFANLWDRNKHMIYMKFLSQQTNLSRIKTRKLLRNFSDKFMNVYLQIQIHEQIHLTVSTQQYQNVIEFMIKDYLCFCNPRNKLSIQQNALECNLHKAPNEIRLILTEINSIFKANEYNDKEDISNTYRLEMLFNILMQYVCYQFLQGNQTLTEN